MPRRAYLLLDGYISACSYHFPRRRQVPEYELRDGGARHKYSQSARRGSRLSRKLRFITFHWLPASVYAAEEARLSPHKRY